MPVPNAYYLLKGKTGIYMQTTQNFVELFLDSAKKHPEQIAIIEKNGETIPYHELRTQVESRAAYLYKHGIRSGDQVLVCIPDNIDLYRNIFALLYLGAIVVLPEDWSDKAQVDLSCKLCDCKALIGIPKTRLSAYFSKTLRKIPVKLEAKSPNFSSIFPLTKVSPDHTALITFSKKAGEPLRAEKRSHQFLFEQLQTSLDILDPQLWEIALHTSPLMLLAYLGIGATSLIGDLKKSLNESTDPDKIIQQLRLFKVNRLTTSPEILVKISEYLIEKVLELPDIQNIYCEGSPILPHQARLFPEAFPHASIGLAYGSSEASPISILSPKELPQDSQLEKGLFVGHILPPTEVKIIEIIDAPIKLSVSDELKLLSKTSGQIGEIIVKGPQVLGAYYDNWQAFEKHKIVEGDYLWHRTGDAGYLKDGKLYYAGKCKDIISVKGEKYGPLFYEYYLRSIKKVKLGTLLLVDAKLTLVVELNKESDKDFVSQKLTHANLRFERVIFMKQIPRIAGSSDSIDRAQLEKLLGKKASSSFDI